MIKEKSKVYRLFSFFNRDRLIGELDSTIGVQNGENLESSNASSQLGSQKSLHSRFLFNVNLDSLFFQRQIESLVHEFMTILFELDG